jgi:hypothetical protein
MRFVKMRPIYLRGKVPVLIYCLVTTSLCFFLWSCQRRSSTGGSPVKTSAPISQRLEEFQERTFTVEPGLEEDAFDYYKATFDELGLNPKGLTGKELVASQSLSQALEFLGYKDLTPKDAEELSSAELMNRFPDDILSSAFFAPKITDVSITPINVGWRKLVRFKAQGDAAKKGIASAFLLFNRFQGAGKFDVDPFKPDKEIESKNTQLILVRGDGSPLKQPVYFLVYGPLSENSKLITFLTASFDARAPGIVKDSKYFVPNACADCHGGLLFSEVDGLKPDYDRLKLNYLDTDHWFDRLDDDFNFLKAHPNGVLYDGGKDETKPKFEAAFDVFRRLNREIKTQNERVEPTPSPTPQNPSFQLRAVTKWLDLHGTNSHHQDVFARALPSIAGDPWRATEMPDKELLPLMNQYCFRCHSSLRFNIFDRPVVVKKKTNILDFMTRVVTDKKSMPQDRNLNCSAVTLAHKNRILKLVCDLDSKPCPTPSPTPITACPTPLPTPH